MAEVFTFRRLFRFVGDRKLFDSCQLGFYIDFEQEKPLKKPQISPYYRSPFIAGQAPLKILKICKREGKRASIDSLAPFVDPGNASTRLSLKVPATLLDNTE